MWPGERREATQRLMAEAVGKIGPEL